MWIRLDDGIFDNPKIIRSGLDGFALYVAGLVYCGRNLSDGHIPAAKAVTLLPWRDGASNRRSIEVLLKLNLWSKTTGGFRVHHWRSYNPSKATVRRRRRSTAERSRRYRARHALRHESQHASRHGVSNAVPVPEPVTDKKKILFSTSTSPEREQKKDSGFESIGQILPRSLP